MSADPSFHRLAERKLNEVSATGAVMDGRHRLAKALLLNRTEIEAVQFERDPEPDFVGRDPGDLPY